MSLISLDEYNKSLLLNYKFESNAQHIVMPGHFRKEEILFVGQNPGLLKESVVGDMKYLSLFKEVIELKEKSILIDIEKVKFSDGTNKIEYDKELKDVTKEYNNKYDSLKRYYLEALKSEKGTIGTFIQDLCGDVWNDISFTNVYKTPFNDNKLDRIEFEEFHLSVLKKQIDLLQPKCIIAIGKTAKIALEKLGLKIDFELEHPSFLKKSGVYKEKLECYKPQIEDLLFKYFITNCEASRNKVFVRYNWMGERKNKMLTYDIFFYLLDEQGKYTSFDGKKCSKVWLKDYHFNSFNEEQAWMKSHKSKLYESDVYHNIRYLINEQCRFDSNQSIFYIDIETKMSTDTVNAPEPIISVAGIDNKNDSYCWVWRGDILKKEEFKNNIKFFYFDNEKEMMSHFFDFFKKQAYDIVATWNGELFDMPYILNRAQKLGIDINNMSPIHKTSLKVRGKNREDVKFRVYGTNHVDLMQVYKKMTYDKRPPSYGLDAVANFLFGGSKIKVSNIIKTWETNIDELLEYNLNDCILLKKIDEYTHLIDLLKTLQNISSCTLDLCLWNKNVCDAYILKTYNGRYVFPDIQDNEREEFEGAITGRLLFNKDGNVKSVAPIPGMFKNVAVIDFSSMYPSIFRTFNVSLDTLDDDGDTEIDGVKFTSKRSGIIPELFENVLTKRKEYEKLRDSFPRDAMEWYIYSNFQAMIKQIGNSLYGLNGYPRFRLFNPKVAKTITYIGRQLIIYSWLEAEKAGFKPLYGDSVDGNTTVLIRVNGLLHTIAIEKLPEFLKVNKIEKDKTFYVPLENVEVLSHDFENNISCFKPLKTIISHKTSKKLHSINKKEYMISATDDHSVFLEDGKLVKGSNINKDTKLKISNYEIDFKNTKTHLDLWEDVLKDEFVRRKNKVNAKYVVKKKSFEIEKVDDKWIKIKRRHPDATFRLPRKIELNYKFGKFLGLFIAEGSTTSDGVGQMRISMGDKVLFEYMKDINEIFKSDLFFIPKWSNFMLKSKTNIVAPIFSYLCGYKSSNKRMPTWVLETNKKFFEGLLRGYLEGDGCKEFRTNDFLNYAGIGSKSKTVISQIFYILKNVYKYKNSELKLAFRTDKKFYSVHWCKEGRRWFDGKVLQKPKIVKSKLKDMFFSKEYSRDLVWDLSVKDTENFVDICGNVVMHNTDSLFTKFDDNLTEDEIFGKAAELEVLLNSKYDDFCLRYKKDTHNFFKVDCEKIFSKIIFAGVKKKYIGRLCMKKGEKVDEVFGRGIDLIKRDTPPAFRKFLKGIVVRILAEDQNTLKDIEIFKKKIMKDYVLSDIGISKGISKQLEDYVKTVPQHIRAARYSNEFLGTNFGKMDVPSLFYVHKRGDKSIEVIALPYDATSLPPGYSINWDKYFDNFIDAKIKMFESIPFMRRQKSIFDF